MSDMVSICAPQPEGSWLTCVSGAVRLEHQFYAIGQACANACDVALSRGLAFQDVPYSELEERLVAQGVILDATQVGAPRFADEL